MKKLSKKILALLLVFAMLIPTGAMTVTTTAADVSIPEDAVEFNGHYYKVFEESMTWKEAKAYCEELGGYLATIVSLEEQNFIVSIAQNTEKTQLWLGGTDEQKEGDWQWITGEEFNYQNWHPSNCDNFRGREHYLTIFTKNTPYESLWNDFANIGYIESDSNRLWYKLEQIGFICEWDSEGDMSGGAGNSTPSTPGIAEDTCIIINVEKGGYVTDLSVTFYGNEWVGNITLNVYTIQDVEIPDGEVIVIPVYETLEGVVSDMSMLQFGEFRVEGGENITYTWEWGTWTDDDSEGDSIEESKYEIELFSGPGTKFASLGKRKINLLDVISVENGFYEIEYKDTESVFTYRAFVKAQELKDADTSKIVTVVDYSGTLKGPYDNDVIVKLPDITLKTISEINLLFGPGKNYIIKDTIEIGNTIKIVYYLDDYAQVEYETENGYARGYVAVSVLKNESADIKSNKEFESLKSSNACFLVNGENVYSSLSTLSSSLKWNTIKSATIVIKDFDFWGGVVSAISGNDIDVSDGNKLAPQTTPNKQQTAESMNAIADGLQMYVNFLTGAVNSQSFKVSVEENSGNKRLIIFSGTRMELMQAGHTYSAGVLLMKNQLYTTSEDEFVRKNFPGYVKDGGKYSMWFNFADEITNTFPGYSIVIKNDGCAYAYHLFNEGTSFPVYRTIDGKTTFEFDAVDIYKNHALKLDEKTTSKLLEYMRQIGIESSFSQTTVKCPVDVSVYDKNDNLLAQTNSGKIVFDNSDDSVTLETIGAAKIVRYPIGENYTIVTSSYGVGTMNYSASTVENAKIKESVLGSDIKIDYSDIFSGTFVDDNTYILKNIESNQNLIDEDLHLPKEMDLNIVKSQGGIVTGQPINTYEGQLILLCAVPYVGYTFSGWYKDGELVSEFPELEFSLTEDTEIEAVFLFDESACENGHVEYVLKGYDSSCNSYGKTDGIICAICNKMLAEQNEIPSTGHSDANHDGICDACSEDFTKGCSCNCHGNAFMQFLHKIVTFLRKLFGMTQYQYCDCGKAHW
ncbi:MAG: hypothetical protein J6Q94_00195 [Clostridia bacterium]|nr:hypothetical protein [Clostridia bacterium]